MFCVGFSLICALNSNVNKRKLINSCHNILILFQGQNEKLKHRREILLQVLLFNIFHVDQINVESIFIHQEIELLWGENPDCPFARKSLQADKPEQIVQL